MASPSTPVGFYVTQANGQVLTQWQLSAGATSYAVERSSDNVTFSPLATVTTTSYIDTSALLGVQYFYRVSATGISGTSPATNSQNTIPTTSGNMSLASVRLAAQQRADRVGSQFVTLPEINSYINQSYFELYDLLTTVYNDYYVAPSASFVTNGTQYLYPLPDGVTLFKDPSGAQVVARPFYKLLGVDLGINTANNGYVTITKFNFIDRNRFVYPNTSSTIYGVFNMQYRLMGNAIEFIPAPSAGQTIRLWYVPRLVELLADTDTLEGVNGWAEYVIVDVAIKVLQKEESDVSILMAQKQALITRINGSATNRDAGLPDTISDSRRSGGWGGHSGGGFNGGTAGW
jgi:hypothetical protein